MLSRVIWPVYPTSEVVSRLGWTVERGEIQRVCIQAINYPRVFEDILSLVREVRSHVEVPISVSCQPLNPEQMRRLREEGVERVSVALDAATEEIFDQVKGRRVGGPYTWRGHLRALEEAVNVFGRGFVTTHLIVGLGEKEEDLARIMQWCIDHGVYPSLFAFTPIPGTALERRPPPPIGKYRRIQIAHYLMTHGETRFERMRFGLDGRILDFGVSGERVWRVVESGRPFLTTGCPGCNRPYYNERPGGTIYNYPRPLTPEEIEKVKGEIWS